MVGKLEGYLLELLPLEITLLPDVCIRGPLSYAGQQTLTRLTYVQARGLDRPTYTSSPGLRP